MTSDCSTRSSRPPLRDTIPRREHSADPDLATDVLGRAVRRRDARARARREGAVEATSCAGRSRRAHRPGGALRARLRRLLLPDRVRRVVDRAAATTSTRSTCASTAARCGSTRPPTTSTTCTTYFEDIDAAWSPDRRARRPRPRRAGRPLDRRAGRVAVGAPPPAGAGRAGAQLPWLDMQGPFLLRTVGTVAVRGVAAPAADAARSAANLNTFYGAEPAPRPRGRVGLRPGLEAAGLVADLLRLAGRHPPRRTPSCTAGSRSACPVLVLCSGASLWPKRDVRATCTATTSCSTSSRSGAGRRSSGGTSPSSSIPGRPARRGAVPPRGAQPRLRRARPLGHGVRPSPAAPPRARAPHRAAHE